jgi:hypothetical protein
MKPHNTIVTFVVTAALFNVVNDIRTNKGERAFTIILGNAGLLAALMLIADTVNPRLSAGLSGLYFLGTFLTHGTPLVTWTSSLVKGLTD